MKRWLAVVLLVNCAPLFAQRFPLPTGLPGSPFSIKNTWIIGGVGNWDYLTMDANARRLYIAHGRDVQVVDVDSGMLAGTVAGFTQAHQVLLDESGQYGYVSDGPASDIKVFDRATLQIVGAIPTAPGPRAIALDTESGLLFAVCSGSAEGPESTNRPAQPVRSRTPARGSAARPKSTITVIDTGNRVALARIDVVGRLGFAQASGNGQVFVTATDPRAILRVDVAQMNAALEKMRTDRVSSAGANQPLNVEWDPAHPSPVASSLHFLRMGSGCNDPLSLAFDSHHLRLFTACSNMVLTVTNADTGAQVTTLPIGPDAQAVAYDANRGLIFTSNGGGDGSLTIIRQSVTDTYSVIQNLPTKQQARTMALDPDTGDVFLVTVLYGAKVGPPPRNGIGTLSMTPIDSSFQVMVVGN